MCHVAGKWIRGGESSLRAIRGPNQAQEGAGPAEPASTKS